MCQVLHHLTHGQLAFESKLELLETSDHLEHQAIHVLAFLQEHKLVGSLLLVAQVPSCVIRGELLFQNLLQDLGTCVLCYDHRTHRSIVVRAGATRPTNEHDQGIEGAVTLHCAEVNLCIRVHAEEEWGLSRHGLDMLQVPLVWSGLRRQPRQFTVGIGNHLDLIQKLIAHEVQQILFAHSAVPIIYNVSTVHDLAEDVPQIVPGNLHGGGSFQVVVKHLGRVSKVARGEWILHVVAHRSKLLSLQHQRVEVAQGEEDGLDLRVAVLEVLFAEECERSPQVGQHPLGRLVGELNRALQDANGNTIARIGREENSKVGMAVLDCEDVQLLLELDAPLGHQVNVLEHDPMTFAVANVKLRHGNDVLALAHGNVPIVGTQLQPDQRLPHGLHLLDRVGARRQDEEDWCGARGVLEGVLKNLPKGGGPIAVHIIPAIWEDVSDPLGQGTTHAIWS
mmetsp:Transcript_33278/g.71326  ORF Transcript_33278/g.71326 Transcript_33278/m.71326 type:complete len:451 (-) Transcript_33278:1539-2891(-)